MGWHGSLRYRHGQLGCSGRSGGQCPSRGLHAASRLLPLRASNLGDFGKCTGVFPCVCACACVLYFQSFAGLVLALRILAVIVITQLERML